jgi:hypothetical protein
MKLYINNLNLINISVASGRYGSREHFWCFISAKNIQNVCVCV